MPDYPGWYPPSQVCYPPDLPSYLSNVHDLKPITGVPSDEEVIGIHAVIQVANRASTIPGMYNPALLMELGDHLFSAQMAVYRSKYTSLMFPSDATYTPPTLPAHVPVSLEPISGAPSDEQVTQVQGAIRSYQKYSEIPSMFDTRLSAELSQHLFDIQMARYMSRAAQRQPIAEHREATQHPTSTRTIERVTDVAEQTATHDRTINAGTGASLIESHQLPEVAIRDILERSNQLAERANQLSEQSNQLIERFNQTSEQSRQQIERSDNPIEQPQPSIDHFANLSERFNELIERLSNHFERSNQLAEEYKKPVERLGEVLKASNKVLVGIQHAIVRNYKNNTKDAINCLINEKGDFPSERLEINSQWSATTADAMYFKVGTEYFSTWPTDDWAINLLRFYGIGEDLFEDCEKTVWKGDKPKTLSMLSQYWHSALGA
ncbi:laminin domain protein, putative [Rhizoctonia solani AG-3 Rhs1AP]|uniref:Laminin domain protein, putative n=1 Tax=Rhizoctonia solani AG-3 Rhs1AP TaxID=1086054 RepID=A0A0A1UIZ2_9AGAM|nr:laminin domain protein, putative [Rhizoctonia solani AG-3 Rhs1AP]